MTFPNMMRIRCGLAALAIGTIFAGGTAQAQVQYPPGAVVQPLGNQGGGALTRHLSDLADNPRNLSALIGAGRAALELGDEQAALTFFARAEEIAPRDARVKAGMASALVHLEQPHTALKFFADAVSLGAPEVEIAKDRGLAYDLVGDPRRAQQDYARVLRRGEDGETRQRLALSLAISGQRDSALAAIDAQARRNERGAGRTRAFVLALSGDWQGATRAAQSSMPPQQAETLAPFFGRLPVLTPAQKAMAVHFGHFPHDGQPSQTALAVDTTPYAGALALAQGVASNPAQHHAAAPTLATPVPPAAQRRRAPAVQAPEERVGAGSRFASRRPARQAPVQTAQAPQPVQQVAQQPVQQVPQSVQQPAQQSQQTPVQAAPQPQQAQPQPVQLTMTPPVQQQQQQQQQQRAPMTWATEPARRTPPAAQPAASSSAQATPPAQRPIEWATAPVRRTPPAEPIQRQAPPPAPVQPVELPPAQIFQPTPAAEAPAPTSLSGATPAKGNTPGFAEIAALVTALPEPAREAPPAVVARPIPPTAAPAAVRPAPARPEPARPEPPKPAAKAEPAKTEPAKAPAARAAPAKAEPAEPSRHWVQVAGGASKADLPRAFAALKAKAPALFASQTGWTTPLRLTNRLLVGPFKTPKDAQDFVNELAKADMSAFAWTSPEGQAIEKLSAR